MRCSAQRTADQAAQLLLPTRQRTNGEELKESTEFENAPTQVAPSGEAEESKSEHQDDSTNNEDPLDPQFDEESVKPTLSPVKMALNVAEQNLPFLNLRAESSRKAHNETANHGETADPAEATQKCGELDKAFDTLQKAEADWDNL